ncbi:MAG TPA: hydroxyisourate hydrolase [Dyella sp.]|nr:hydroxyisourate hydrolase [Dyella sp.]
MSFPCLRRLAALLLLSPALALAAGNPLSVHVLNLQDGLPSPGMTVTLERQDQGRWISLSEGVTDSQGRIGGLYPDGQPLRHGVYRVTFKTGAWFAQRRAPTFFPEVPVIVAVDGSLPHYHVPLLLSPYGYSVYRGN